MNQRGFTITPLILWALISISGLLIISKTVEIGYEDTTENLTQNTQTPSPNTPQPSPITKASATPSNFKPIPSPKTINSEDSQKSEKMLALIKRIIERYTEVKFLAQAANVEIEQFKKCIAEADEFTNEQSKPHDFTVGGGQNVAPGENPVGEQFTIPNFVPAPALLRNISDERKATCTFYLNRHDSLGNYIGPAEEDIKQWKEELQTLTINCSSCLPLYNQSIKKFDELHAEIWSILKSESL